MNFRISSAETDTNENEAYKEFNLENHKLLEFEGYGFKEISNFNYEITEMLDRIEVTHNIKIDLVFEELKVNIPSFYQRLKDNYLFCKRNNLKYSFVVFTLTENITDIYVIDMMSITADNINYKHFNSIQSFCEIYINSISNGNNKKEINKNFDLIDQRIREIGYRWPGNCDGILTDSNYKPLAVLEFQKVNYDFNQDFRIAAYKRLFLSKSEKTKDKAIITKQWLAIQLLAKKLKVPDYVIFWKKDEKDFKVFSIKNVNIFSEEKEKPFSHIQNIKKFNLLEELVLLSPKN